MFIIKKINEQSIKEFWYKSIVYFSGNNKNVLYVLRLQYNICSTSETMAKPLFIFMFFEHITSETIAKPRLVRNLNTTRHGSVWCLAQESLRIVVPQK